MQENLVIFLIVLLIVILLCGVGIAIWSLRSRLDIGTTYRGGTTTAGSDTSSRA
jgi:flagellar basal body-associated protein FliL